MKRIIFTLIFVKFLFTPTMSNEPGDTKRTRLDRVDFIALYNKLWQEDSNDIYNIREEPMILLVGEEYSKFYSFDTHFLHDSILPRYPVEQWKSVAFSGNRPATNVFYRIFKNKNENSLEFFQSVGIDPFKYTMPLNAFQWNILPDTKQMFGYSVQKATTSFAGRDWVAWFAAEIPISDGPYKFNGLPGLIVLLHDTRNHYRFALTSFTKSQGERYLQKTGTEVNYFHTTRKRMIEMSRRFVQDPFSFMPNITPMGGVAQRQAVLDRMRRRNNLLELRY